MGEDDDKDEEDEEEDNSEDEDEEEEVKEEEYSDKENDNTDDSQGRKWRKRLHVLEKKQEWMEKLLQRLFVKYSDDRGCAYLSVYLLSMLRAMSFFLSVVVLFSFFVFLNF